MNWKASRQCRLNAWHHQTPSHHAIACLIAPRRAMRATCRAMLGARLRRGMRGRDLLLEVLAVGRLHNLEPVVFLVDAAPPHLPPRSISAHAAHTLPAARSWERARGKGSTMSQRPGRTASKAPASCCHWRREEERS
eukprot:1774097-Rhodomonas_salina.1